MFLLVAQAILNDSERNEQNKILLVSCFNFMTAKDAENVNVTFWVHKLHLFSEYFTHLFNRIYFKKYHFITNLCMYVCLYISTYVE
jgi:hypothetical protein